MYTITKLIEVINFVCLYNTQGSTHRLSVLAFYSVIFYTASASKYILGN